MYRNPQNTNLRLHYQDSYLGFPVQAKPEPLIVEYLDLLYLTAQRALAEHPRTFAFRVDLRFPEYFDCTPYLHSNLVVDSFIASFKAKIQHNRAQAEKNYGHAHGTTVRYVWAREIAGAGRPHYHLVMFLNNDAFASLGTYEVGRNNMFNRLREAWATALGLSTEVVNGLIELPPNPCYYLRRDDEVSFAKFFHRASYLCKAATKIYGNGCHAFGASRR